jgi:predicted AAA+ superfamily ATPase
MKKEKKYIPREITKKLQKLKKNFPSIVVVGARQVGKSTLLKHLFPDYSYVLFDPYEDVENARKDPELFLDNHTLPIILDEVQYAPEVVSAIKRRIEKDKRKGQYIFTGSQNWGVMKNMVESLTGRTAILQLDSFSLSEISQSFERKWLEEFLEDPKILQKKQLQFMELPKKTYEQLWRGFLPDAQTLPLDVMPAFHDTYQKTFIEKDIRMLADIPNLHQFSRFVKLITGFTGREINYEELGRDIGRANQTARRWITLLKEIFQWHEIPPFFKNSTKRLSKKSKGYFSDTGQVCFSQAITTPLSLSTHPLFGNIFETAVVNDIKKQISVMTKPCNMYHFRAHSGMECDLILERDGVYYPIEIKAKTNPSKKDARGILNFRKAYRNLKVSEGIVICLSKHFFKLTDRDYVVPWNVKSFL